MDGKITLPHAGAFWRYLGFKVRDLSVQTDIRTDDKIVKSKEGNEMKTILDKKIIYIYLHRSELLTVYLEKIFSNPPVAHGFI